MKQESEEITYRMGEKFLPVMDRELIFGINRELKKVNTKRIKTTLKFHLIQSECWQGCWVKKPLYIVDVNVS
jgi:hypothetical protein